MELEHRALWAPKRLNFKHDEAIDAHFIKLHSLDEFQLKEFESSTIYKEKMKRWRHLRILKREFAVGDLIILYNSRMWMFLKKLKSKWSEPFMITEVLANGVIEVENLKR